MFAHTFIDHNGDKALPKTTVITSETVGEYFPTLSGKVGENFWEFHS